MLYICLAIILAPLLGALVAGLFGKKIGKVWAHRAAILGVGIAFALSAYVLKVSLETGETYNLDWYTWAQFEGLSFHLGFLIDRLSALMMVVVTFVSLMIHIYTIGYMCGDPGYCRFFSHIALFTFSMLMLVMANNFLQLFFGWEAVGLVSYLLIGFWFKRESAVFAGLKAFLVNRVGDFGFLLGIAVLLYYMGSLDYLTVFSKVPDVIEKGATLHLFGEDYSVITLIALLLFVGAMGKSAQIPLHVWLPDSMEGPTPISALIHAATMVTAGVFMVARLSPIYEYSEAALEFILVIGAMTAILMGLVGIVQNDIKRVIAYSTLSQLGYMMVAQGVSAYAAGIFHLVTHAFFKALLFLAAGSVILAMHHEQDIRKMGNLKKYMPITYLTAWVGGLALIGFPLFSGFYSKDMIIEAVQASNRVGADFAYNIVVAGVFVTALYTFRMFFLVFHGKERMDTHTREHLRESPWVVWVPLVLLAIPAFAVAWIAVEPLLFQNFWQGSIFVLPEHNVLQTLSHHYQGVLAYAKHALSTLPFLLALLGLLLAWFIYGRESKISAVIKKRFAWVHWVLENKYGFDEFNQKVFAWGGLKTGSFLWKAGDVKVIDGMMVNGSARMVGSIAMKLRSIQSGYLYTYVLTMLLGVLAFLLWFILFSGRG